MSEKDKVKKQNTTQDTAKKQQKRLEKLAKAMRNNLRRRKNQTKS